MLCLIVAPSGLGKRLILLTQAGTEVQTGFRINIDQYVIGS